MTIASNARRQRRWAPRAFQAALGTRNDEAESLQIDILIRKLSGPATQSASLKQTGEQVGGITGYVSNYLEFPHAARGAGEGKRSELPCGLGFCLIKRTGGC